ncbi:gliding motility protein GldB-related protein [Tellurirhabdus rosea]|uniref:gliding motility protein GldB-related protein n=1 Tax=Tellurirhabdus rosea TaxID=2674997 RepID=UPI00225BFC7A|nr:gliding motility protein [Tellurirhabdus rosea]
MKVLHVVFLLVSLLILNACSNEQPPVFIQRADAELFQVKSREQVRQWLIRHQNAARVYFNVENPVADTALVNELTRRVNDKELNLLYQQTNEAFGTLGDLAGPLSEAFGNIQKEFPSFRPPRVVGMVTGFMGPDLVVSDSLVVIGLDWFAGPQAKYRPDVPNYILRRYQKEYIVPAIVLALSKPFNAENRTDQTLLADMVYYGKGFVFTKTMLPETPDSLLLGYTDRQLTSTYAAQDLVWAHFLDNQLLYQTNPRVKERYLTERPFTAEVGPKAPGAIGRWLGWRIVGKYNDEKKPEIRALMNNTNARQIFEESGYRGQGEE